MKVRYGLLVLGLALVGYQCRAAEPNGVVVSPAAPGCPPKVIPAPGPWPTPAPGTSPTAPPSTTPGTTPGTMPGTDPGTTPGTTPGTEPGTTPAATGDMFAGAPEAGTPGTDSGQLLGDLNYFGQIAFRASFATTSGSGQRVVVSLPRIARGGYKITENESPRPQTRVFVAYNYYDKLGADSSESFNLHREMFGFEYAFLNGDASIGIRVPYLQQTNSAVNTSDFGDISIIAKFALINDAETGNLLSAGMVVTVPTAGDNFLRGSIAGRLNTGAPGIINAAGPDEDEYLLQPFVGYIWNMDRLYVHGFTACVFSTDQSRDPVLLTNDIGVGYRLYRNDCGALRSIIPTLEAHITTPLSKRDDDDLAVLQANPNGSPVITFPDIVVLTGGVHIGLFDGLNLTLGAATPVTGPKVFDFEGIAQLNLRF